VWGLSFGFSHKTPYAYVLSYTRSTSCPTHFPLLDAITLILFGKTTDHAYRCTTMHIVAVHLPTAFWSVLLGRNVFFRILFSTEVRNAYKIIVRKPVLRSTDQRSDCVGYTGCGKSAGSILYHNLAVLCAVANLRCPWKAGSSLFINDQQNTLSR